MAILLLTIYREMLLSCWRSTGGLLDRAEGGGLAGHFGYDRLEDVRNNGADAWIRDRAAHRAGFARIGEFESRDAVSGTLAPAAARMDLFGVGSVGKQSQGQ